MIEFEKGNASYSNTYPNASYFSNLSVSYEPLLPVTILSFTVEANSSNVRLSWNAAETGLAGYNVCRNTSDVLDTATMITTQMIPASNSDVPVSYNYVDHNVVEGNTYYYWLEALDTNANPFIFGSVSVVYNPAANEENTLIPIIEDAVNFPNPFNPDTTISFTLNQAAKAEIKVYNTKGQFIRTLSNGHFPAGSNEIVFKADDLSSGVYFYSIQTESNLIWRTMVLVK
jgi:hypothetical protein